jgi:hypothetical protein
VIRTFVFLPVDVASEPAEVAGYVASEAGRPATSSDHVLCVPAAIEGWNERVMLHGLSEALVRCDVDGDTVRVRVPDHAIPRLLPILQDVSRPAVLYDADRRTLQRLGRSRLVKIDIGGERAHSAVALDELQDWVPRLHQLASTPFLIARKPGQDMMFIQTYRGSPLAPHEENPMYTLEVSDGSQGRLYTTEIDDPLIVAELIWDWIEDRWERLYRLQWQRYGYGTDLHQVSLRDERENASQQW